MIGAKTSTAQIRSSSAILYACLLMGLPFLIACSSSHSSDPNIRSIPTIAIHSNKSPAVETGNLTRQDVSASTFGLYPTDKATGIFKPFNPAINQLEVSLKMNTDNQRRVVHKFENAQTLTDLKSSGFLSAGDKDDQLVRDGMAKSQAFSSENKGDKELVSP
ncbi:MAG: hypothetical protein P8N76_19270 [Pirellulaceae bacterium]|nr:hypothetical protein [Pirellulaceae bacterium]